MDDRHHNPLSLRFSPFERVRLPVKPNFKYKSLLLEGAALEKRLADQRELHGCFFCCVRLAAGTVEPTSLIHCDLPLWWYGAESTPDTTGYPFFYGALGLNLAAPAREDPTCRRCLTAIEAAGGGPVFACWTRYRRVPPPTPLPPCAHNLEGHSLGAIMTHSFEAFEEELRALPDGVATQWDAWNATAAGTVDDETLMEFMAWDMTVLAECCPHHWTHLRAFISLVLDPDAEFHPIHSLYFRRWVPLLMPRSSLGHATTQHQLHQQLQAYKRPRREHRDKMNQQHWHVTWLPWKQACRHYPKVLQKGVAMARVRAKEEGKAERVAHDGWQFLLARAAVKGYKEFKMKEPVPEQRRGSGFKAWKAAAEAAAIAAIEVARGQGAPLQRRPGDTGWPLSRGSKSGRHPCFRTEEVAKALKETLCTEEHPGGVVSLFQVDYPPSEEQMPACVFPSELEATPVQMGLIRACSYRHPFKVGHPIFTRSKTLK